MLLYYSTLFNKDDWDSKLIHETEEARIYLMTHNKSPFPTMTPEDTVVTTIFNDCYVRLVSVSDGVTESLYFYMYKLPENTITYEEAIALLPTELQPVNVLIASPLELFFFNPVYHISLTLAVIIPLLLATAFYTLFERKAMSAIQRRLGPNVVGFWGFLQPLADGLKLIVKEVLLPRKANIFLFLFAPLLTFFLSILNWIVIPFSYDISVTELNSSVLYLLSISSVAVYGIILAGWASNSKYTLLGSLRAAAQMISYEISISLSIIPIILLSGSLNLMDIVYIQNIRGLFIFPLLPIAFIFFISILAETNRAPFDMPEAEAEIVAGYNLEYSSIIFAFFFLGEYSNMIAMSALFVIFFFGGSHPAVYFLPLELGPLFFSVKVVFICFLFIKARAAVPRYRYDQLMGLNWKGFLPLLLGLVVGISSIIFSFDIYANTTNILYIK